MFAIYRFIFQKLGIVGVIGVLARSVVETVFRPKPESATELIALVLQLNPVNA